VLFRSYSKYLKRYVLDLLLKLTMQRLLARLGSFSTYFGSRETYLIRILIMVVVFSANPNYLTLDPLLARCITRWIALLGEKEYGEGGVLRWCAASGYQCIRLQYLNSVDKAEWRSRRS